MTKRPNFAIAIALLTLSANSAIAQIEDNIAAYSGGNAQAYMEPLRSAFSSGLSDGLFSSADIGQTSPYVRLDLRAMVIMFDDSDREFDAVTEDYFPGSGSTTAPTVVGSSTGATFTDPGSNTEFEFPGGLDLSGIALAAPQIVVGGVMGTEGILRFFSADLGSESALGDVSLFGIGARHSLSQYFAALPVSVSAMVFYQNFGMGNGLVDFEQTSFGLQASKRIAFLEPYAGLSVDRANMSSKYQFDNGSGNPTTISIDFEERTNQHLTLGTALRFFVVHINGEVNISEQTSYALGISFGN
jgi:hypothetical protein